MTDTLDSRELAAGHTNLVSGQTPNPWVRYTSGQAVYVECTDGSRWLSQYWSAVGQINLPADPESDAVAIVQQVNMPGDSPGEEAFRLEVDGSPVSTGWTFVSVAEAPETERGAREVIVELSNASRSLRVKVHTLLTGLPVLTRWLEITNGGPAAVSLNSVSPWSGRLWYGKTFALGYYAREEWSNEGWYEWHRLEVGPTMVKSDKGQAYDEPFFVVRNEVTGEYFICHLAWPANWLLDFAKDDKGLTFSFGPDAADVQRVIAPGETIRTPSVHMGHVSGSFDSAVQAMHDHLRRFVVPARPQERLGLVEYTVAADQGFFLPFEEASAMKCVDVAAAVGCEVFILDCGWWDIGCDWVPSKARFPRGLGPLREHVREKGMLFGLYVEAEGVPREDIRGAKVYAEHPEWFGPKNIVQLTIPEAAAWMESEICRLVEEHDLDLWRLDYNPLFTFEGTTTNRDGITENNYWRYYEALYDIYERIHEKYPNLILQQAAGGGARDDVGMAGRFHEMSVTDGLSFPRELQTYAGLTLGLPPENLYFAHSADGRGGMFGPHDLDLILRMTFTTCTPVIFNAIVAPSVEDLSAHRRERFLHYAGIYKEFIRPLLPTCKMYHHEPINARGGVESSPWFAVEYAAPDRSKGWALIARMRNAAGDDFVFLYGNEYSNKPPHEIDASARPAFEEETYVFKPRGLDPAGTYRVTFDSLDSIVSVPGLRLCREGLHIRLENAGMSELILFEAE